MKNIDDGSGRGGGGGGGGGHILTVLLEKPMQFICFDSSSQCGHQKGTATTAVASS